MKNIMGWTKEDYINAHVTMWNNIIELLRSKEPLPESISTLKRMVVAKMGVMPHLLTQYCFACTYDTIKCLEILDGKSCTFCWLYKDEKCCDGVYVTFCNVFYSPLAQSFKRKRLISIAEKIRDMN